MLNTTETVKPAAPIAAEKSASPKKPAATASPMAQNAYLEIVNKRLRTLKKRLAKIEKYEEDVANGLKNKLNEDQLQAIDKKGEVVMLMKELEDLAKQISDKDAEEEKLKRKQKRADVIAAQKRATELTESLKTEFSDRLKMLSRLVVAVTTLLPQLPNTVVTKTDTDSLIDLYHSLVGAGGFEGDFEACINAKHGLLHQMILERHSIEEVDALLTTLFDFVKAPVESTEVVEEEPPQSVEVQYVATTEQPAAPISFMTSSALMEETTVDPTTEAMQNDSAIIMARVQLSETKPVAENLISQETAPVSTDAPAPVEEGDSKKGGNNKGRFSGNRGRGNGRGQFRGRRGRGGNNRGVRKAPSN